MEYHIFILFLLYRLCCGTIEPSEIPKRIENGTRTNTTIHHMELFRVVNWKFEEMKNYFIYSLFILVVICMKIGYYHVPKVKNYIPELCLLMILGIVFGLIIKFMMKEHDWIYFKLTPELFFYILLPPIILESSYSLYHRNFLDNVLSILLLAILGTTMSFLIIGFALFGFGHIGMMKKLELSLSHCLLFSSLIVSVDPVAVLAIFKEIGVNEDLHYLVYGEALVNNAIIVVLYKMIKQFDLMKSISSMNVFLGFVSMIIIPIGGLIIGIVFGVLSCLIIRVMENTHEKFLEPLILFSMGYISYLVADLVGWSGFISMIACCLMQAGYAMPRMSYKSNLVLKRIIKMLASISESLIFLFLGVEIVIGKHHWEFSFIICALFLCIVTRFIVIFSLSGLINLIHASMRNIPLREKIIISYGGLRGAVAFSLAVLLKPDMFNNSIITNDAIITATLIIIIFTIIVQGITIKPLVKQLRISRMNTIIKIGLFNELNESVFDAATKGVEAIIGKCGRYIILTKIENFNRMYLQPLLQGSNNSRAKLLEMNDKINSIMMSCLSISPDHELLQNLPCNYKTVIDALKCQHNLTDESFVPERKLRRKSKLFRNTISYNSKPTSPKPIKRLMPFLKKPSQFVIDENDNKYVHYDTLPPTYNCSHKCSEKRNSLQKINYYDIYVIPSITIN